MTWVIIAWKKRCLSGGVRNHENYMLCFEAFSLHIWNTPLGNCIFNLKYYWTWTLAGHGEHFFIGQGQICSTVCHRQGDMIKIYLSELLTTKGKYSAFGFGECVWFSRVVKIQAAMKKTLKSLDDKSVFIAVLCMLFYSVISKLLCNWSNCIQGRNFKKH